MQNAAHNGFGCPFCRTAMAEEPKEDDDEDQWSDVSEEDQNEVYDDYALRGLRFMTNNLEGATHDILDVHDEDEEARASATEQEEAAVAVPSPAYITAKLVEQGVTMEFLVKALLFDHPEYDDDEELASELNRACDEVYGKMRIILSNYTPPPTPAEVDEILANVGDDPHAFSTPVTPVTPVARAVQTPSAPLRQEVSEPKPHIAPRRLVSEFIHEL